MATTACSYRRMSRAHWRPPSNASSRTLTWERSWGRPAGRAWKSSSTLSDRSTSWQRCSAMSDVDRELPVPTRQRVLYLTTYDPARSELGGASWVDRKILAQLPANVTIDV